MYSFIINIATIIPDKTKPALNFTLSINASLYAKAYRIIYEIANIFTFHKPVNSVETKLFTIKLIINVIVTSPRFVKNPISAVLSEKRISLIFVNDILFVVF